MSDGPRKIVEWSVDRIESHPDNRPVNVRSPRYAEIRDSIRDNGIQQPLIVRQVPGLANPSRAQCLCGHHRLAAARELGLATVPVDHRGQLSDAAAFDVMAISNLHIPLTPLEEGQRAARWLDVYDQDAQAVAAKLGQTPRWVVEHAQIYRGLTAEWQKAAGDNSYFDRWTSSHWAVIAKLPATLQGQLLGKFTNGAFCSFDRWSVKELEDRIGHKTFLLAKAPFPRDTCTACPNRTGQQPLFLWSDTAEGATGDKERCLDAKCWKRKCEKAERKAFQAVAEAKGLDNAVPLCLLKPPREGWGRERDEYNKAVSACRRAHKGLVLADRVKVVKETTPGAIPAIVVAGVGKGSVKWVKIQEVEAGESGREDRGPRRPTAKELARQKGEDRWGRVLDRLTERICAAPAPNAVGILYIILFLEGRDLYGAEWQKALGRIVGLAKVGGKEFERELCDSLWAEMTKGGPQRIYWGQDIQTTLDAVCPMYGLDPKAIYAELEGEDARAEASGGLRDEDRATSDETRATSDETRATSDETRATSDAATGKPSGPIECPEKIRVPMDKAWQAAVTIQIAQVDCQWYVGWDAHVPKAGDCMPCSTAHRGYRFYGEALMFAVARLTAWLDGQPGRKGYKHYDAIKEAVGQAVTAAMDAATRPDSAAGRGVMRCTFPPAARDPIAEPPQGERTCRKCGKVEPGCTHCAGTVCEVCRWEKADLCAACAAEAARPKRGRPVGSKDKTKRKTRGAAAGSSDEARATSDADPF